MREEEILELSEKAVELLSQRKFAEFRSLLSQLVPADISLLMENIPDEWIFLFFRILPKETAADTFVYLDGDVQQKLIHAFSDSELRQMIDELYLDDAVDLIEEMPANVVKRILRNSSADMRKQINEILKYSKDSAGSIMTTEYVDLKRYMTVGQAFDRIRSTGVDKETIYTCYVTDENRILLGIVSVKDLLLAGQNDIIGDIMESNNIISVNTLEDKESVANQFNKYDFLAIPVVDSDERLVGIITFDDAMDVIQEETEEDFAKMAAITNAEESYFKTPAFTHARHRIVWLLFLMLSATITGTILTGFEAAIAAAPLLVSFIPMLMDTSGNCGSQASTLIIRGMALGEIRPKDVFRVVRKELSVASMVGLALSFVNFIRILIMYHSNPHCVALGLVISVTLFFTVIIAKIIGCTLPLLAKTVKLDPALMASPMITTIVDCCAMVIYFAIASHFLDYLH